MMTTWDRYDGGENVTPLHDGKPAVLLAARALNPEQIPPRQWLYGTTIIRGAVSVLVAPGGTGKSLWALTVGASLAIGRGLLGDHVHQRVKVWILNLDDPLDELDRRFLALRMHYALQAMDFEEFLFMESGDERKLTMARMADDGFTVLCPDEPMVAATIRSYGIGLMVVDPYAETNEVDENSNSQMIHAVAAWRRIARACSCAILLVHHVRKGAMTDIESARGARALTDSARVGLLMSPMSAAEAEALGIEDEGRTGYVRLDNAKANLAPRPAVATWFHLEQVAIGNPTDQYPNGDRVAVITTWEPPSAWDGLDPIILDRIFRRFEEGSDGEYYSFARQAKDRWAGNVIMEETGRTAHQASTILAAWKKNQVIAEGTYVSNKRGQKPTGRLIVNPVPAAEMRREAQPP